MNNKKSGQQLTCSYKGNSMEQKVKDKVNKYLSKPNVKGTIDDIKKDIIEYGKLLKRSLFDEKIKYDFNTGKVEFTPVPSLRSLEVDIDIVFKDFNDMFKDSGDMFASLGLDGDEDFIKLNPTNEILVNTIGEYIDLDYLETEESDFYKSLKCGVDDLFKFEVIERKDRSVYFISEGNKVSMVHSPEDALKGLKKFFEYEDENLSKPTFEDKECCSGCSSPCTNNGCKIPEDVQDTLEINLDYVISKATQNGWKYEENVVPRTGPKGTTWKHVFTRDDKCWYSHYDTYRTNAQWFPYAGCKDDKSIHALKDLLSELTISEYSSDSEYEMRDVLIKAGFVKNGKFLSKNGISVQLVIDADGTYYLYDEVKIRADSECSRMLIQAAQNAGQFKKIYGI